MYVHVYIIQYNWTVVEMHWDQVGTDDTRSGTQGQTLGNTENLTKLRQNFIKFKLNKSTRPSTSPLRANKLAANAEAGTV